MDQHNLLQLILSQMQNYLGEEPLTQAPQPTTGLQTPPPRPHADRYYTAVAVDKVVNGIVREVKWFPDFQMAWIWIDGNVKDQVEQGDTREWQVKSFQTAADLMDERWEDGDDGVVIARTLNTEGNRTRYTAFYEPEETRAVRAFHYGENANQQQVQGPATPPMPHLEHPPYTHNPRPTVQIPPLNLDFRNQF